MGLNTLESGTGKSASYLASEQETGARLVQDIEKHFRVGFKKSVEIDLIMPVKENRKKLVD